MRRKPLFPPPISPTTGKRKRNKGKQPYTILTINGRIRWHCCEDGTSTLTDCLLDEAECTVSHGAKELICRLNQSSASFRKTSENLKRAAQLESNDETQSHCHVSVTRGNHEAAGRLMARDAKMVGLREADERIANVDGAPWIRAPSPPVTASSSKPPGAGGTARGKTVLEMPRGMTTFY